MRYGSWLAFLDIDKHSENACYEHGEPDRDAEFRPVPGMIRADGGAPYRIIQKVFEACARSMVWKIEIGAAKPAKD